MYNACALKKKEVKHLTPYLDSIGFCGIACDEKHDKSDTPNHFGCDHVIRTPVCGL